MPMVTFDAENDFIKSFVSEDGTVRGLLSVNGASITIHEWGSSKEGQGRTITALNEIGEISQSIHVVGVGGSNTDLSWTYWTHMHFLGLIESMEDSYGNDVDLATQQVEHQHHGFCK